MGWSKLLSRYGVDLTTIGEIDRVFFSLLEEFGYEKRLFTILQERQFTHYIGVNTLAWARKTYQKYFSSTEKIKAYYKEGLQLLDEAAQRRKAAALRAGLLEALKLLRQEYEKVCNLYSTTSWLAIEGWQHDFEAVVKNLLVKKELNKEEVIRAITQPWKKTTLNELQERLAAGEPPERLAEEYSFLGSWALVWRRDITTAWVKSIRRAQREEEHLTFDEALALLNPNEKERDLLQLAPYILFFKNWRDDLRRKHAESWQLLFKKIAEHFDVEKDDLGYLMLDELEEALVSNTLPREKITRRKEGVMILWDGEMVIQEEIPEEYQRIIAKVEADSPRQEVRGLVAYPGKVRGVARIVRSHHELQRVAPGDILIANTTHPDFLPVMQKVVAFVTNEGGLSSHAAIVAREMKKPCIVGTGNATSVFKDGDLLEVDAEQGVVKRV